MNKEELVKSFNDLSNNFWYEVEERAKIQERLDKAIEYIDKHIVYECDDVISGMRFCSYHLYDFKKEDLLKILKGESNE